MSILFNREGNIMENLLKSKINLTPDGKSTLFEAHILQQKVVDLLLEYRNSNGISVVTPQELSVKLMISPALVAKIIKKLQMCECVKILRPGYYEVQQTNLLERGPISKTMALVAVLSENSDFSQLPYIEQAEALHMTVHQLQMAYGYARTIISEESREDPVENQK